MVASIREFGFTNPILIDPDGPVINDAGNEWQSVMRNDARRVLNAWNGDLAIIGVVKVSEQALNSTTKTSYTCTR